MFDEGNWCYCYSALPNPEQDALEERAHAEFERLLEQLEATRQALERRIMEATYGATPEERALFVSNPATQPPPGP